MKICLVICLFLLCAVASNAAHKQRDSKVLSRGAGTYAPVLKMKKAFFSPVRNTQQGQQSETFHLDNCNRTVSQCRNNGNDNFISGHTLPLALITCTRSQHACPVLPHYTSTLSRLLLFPNHYFW